MAPSNKPAATPADDVDAMFGDNIKALKDSDFAGLDDLLDEVEEDDSEGWVPTEKGEGLVGIVVKVGETRSDYARPGENPMVPNVTLECLDPSDPNKTVKWRIIGYGAVLQRELKDADPKPGDRMAIKYFGEKILKKGPYAGKTYKHYGVSMRRAG